MRCPISEARPAALEAACARFETPCGDGVMVWRRWGAGPPVVLAHGSHGSWMHWVRNIAALAPTRTVWAVDLPGWGESALAPADHHEAVAAVLAEGLRTLMADALPVDLVGFSLGGVIFAHFAGFYPELARRLVLVDTGGLDTPLGVVKLRGMRGLDAAGRRQVNKENLLALMLRHAASVDALALEIQAAGGRQARVDPAPYVLPDRLKLALPKVQCPVAAIWAEFDQPHPDPAAQAAVLRQIIPGMEFHVIADSGHWVMYERPEAFNALLAELLEKAQWGKR